MAKKATFLVVFSDSKTGKEHEVKCPFEIIYDFSAIAEIAFQVLKDKLKCNQQEFEQRMLFQRIAPVVEIIT
jgi:hypothetical protein